MITVVPPSPIQYAIVHPTSKRVIDVVSWNGESRGALKGITTARKGIHHWFLKVPSGQVCSVGMVWDGTSFSLGR